MKEVCSHCLIPVSETEVIREDIDGKERAFCCAGCQGVFHVLHNSGLDAFYERRTGWHEGPPEQVRPSPDLFRDSVVEKDGFNEIDISLSGIRCASCVWLIEKFLMKSDGVLRVRVNYATHRARIQWDPDKTDIGYIVDKIASIGYIPHPYSASVYDTVAKEEKKDLLIRFGTASFFSMQLMLYTAALYAGYFHGMEPLYKKLFQYIAWALSTPVMFYSGYPFISNTIRGIRNKMINMDTLIFLGSFSAYAYSVAMIFAGGEVYFDTSSMIITLILLGRYVESGAKSKAVGAISSLLGLQPKEARLIKRPDRRPGESKPVPAASLKKGDLIEVIPGDTIPLDAEVLDGSSEVDESMLSGEPMPVLKSPGEEVYGGTTNLNGRLVLRVLKTGKDTVLAHIIRTIEDAQARKAPIQTVADSVVRWFVPAIILTAVFTFAYRYGNDKEFASSLLNSIAVLVIACPCALGLSVPLAVLRGSSLLSSKGILVRGGDILEAAARTDIVSFDKTGTLTEGKPSLSGIVGYGMNEKELHIIAASLESGSEHVISRAIKKGITDKEIIQAEDFRAFPGKGVRGAINGKKTFIGNIGFLRSNNVSITGEQMETFESLSREGKTTVGLAVENSLKGWFIISDGLRPEAERSIELLKSSGRKITLLTGDHKEAAEYMAGKVGIINTARTGNEPKSVISEVSPLEKAEVIKEFKARGHTVMMVGDGINDAPALAEADVGVAFGKATDIAIRSAGVVLMKDDPILVPKLLTLSRGVLRTIKQNLFWAFSYNFITVPLAVSGKIHPIVSAVLMAVSSLIVVGNSLRLKIRS